MKKENKKGNGIIQYIIIGVITVVILVLGFLLLKGCSNENDNKTSKKIPASEEQIKNAYDMSKEDAINIVKALYNSDVYEFEAKINEDSKYVVTVKNTITESVTKFLVDPTSTNGSFYEINE